MAEEQAQYRTVIADSGELNYTKRVLIGVPVTGILRVEWVQARYGQIIPVNWSHVETMQWMDSLMPLRYVVDDAQNLIVKAAVEGDFEWLLLYEHDVCPPPDAFIRLNQYMRDEIVPVVSGLYYTRNRPSEPLVFRGRGNSVFLDWELGDKVYVDGLPTGFLLIHGSILKLMWNESPEYAVRNMLGQSTVVRRVFETPRKMEQDPETRAIMALNGTSDLYWCDRVMSEDVLRRAGWGKYVDGLEDQRYPFLIDTNLFCRHINIDGTQFP